MSNQYMIEPNLEFIDELTVNQYLEDLGQRLVSRSDKPDSQRIGFDVGV